MISFGQVPSGSVLPIIFDSFKGSDGSSITLTGLAVTDVEIYKGGSVTQRSSDAGYVLIDTDGIDIDGITGIHGFTVDTGDNTDAGFYAVGSFFTVVVSAVTIDAVTVNFVAATFRMGPAEGVTGHAKVDVGAWLGTAAATPTVAGVPEVDVTHWIGTAAATPTVAGVPEVDVTHWIGTAAATPTIAGVPEVDITHLLGTAWLVPGTAGTPDVNTKLAGAVAWTAGAITAAVIGTGAIDADALAANAITDTSIAADAITAAKIAAGAIDAATFAAGAINAAAIAADAITAAKVADGAIDRATFAADTGLQTIRSNTAQAGAAGTITLDASASATDNIYTDTVILLTGGTGAGQVRRIRAYVGATKVATVIPVWTTNPDVTSTFAILPVTSVWDETLADHLDTGSTGTALNAAGSAGDPWATAIPGAYGAGTAGKIVGDNVNATISSRASQTSLDTVDDFLDTEIAAIKAKTDSLTFTTALRVDSQVFGMQASTVTAAAVATGAIDADAVAADAVTEIQAGLATPTNITAGTITTVTNLTNAPTSGDLTATMKASVNTEALDVLNVDTFAEPGQEAPAATSSLVKKIGYLYKAFRNRITQTSTALKVYADDATTVDQKATVSDDATTYDRGEIGTGP